MIVSPCKSGSDNALEEIIKFIAANRERMALVRSLRESDPDKAREIESYTIDLDGDARSLDHVVDFRRG